MKTLVGVLLVTELFAVRPDGLGQSVAGSDPEQLHQKAVALYSTPPRYAEAAELHVREAELRGGGPKAADALVRAARLRGYTGNTPEALRLMKLAATVAVDCGDVVPAAHAYIDAGFFALRLQRVNEARSLFKRAERLAESPLLDTAARAIIIRRLSVKSENIP